MPNYTEEDPLLPSGKGAPEIQGSRPHSFKDVYSTAETGVKELPNYNINRPLSERANNIISAIFTLCFTLSIVLIIIPQSIYDDVFKHFRPRPHPLTMEQRVNKILTNTPLIDGHNDLAILVRFAYNNQIYDDKFTELFEKGGMPMHVDLPRLKEGKNGGAFWSAFVPCPENVTDFSDTNYAPSVAFTFTQLDLLRRLQFAYPTHFSPPPNSSTALAAFKSGQLISPLAIEGLHQIGNSVSNLRIFHALGVRYATLTHNCHNIYADAALTAIKGSQDAGIAIPKWGGVSPAGKELIHEMNRIGMIVDLAHVSVDTMRDVLGGSPDWEGSLAPPIYSHSSAYALCPHPRNVPDSILQLVKNKNSIVMVNFSPSFISCVHDPDSPTGSSFYPPNSTIAQVVLHIKHIGILIGYDHVGLGSDFDGIPTTPEGLDDVSKYPALVAEMLEQGISDEDAEKVVGGNLLRVWKEVDDVAARLQASGVKPLEDKLPSLWDGSGAAQQMSGW